jgi:hypothetical protein
MGGSVLNEKPLNRIQLANLPDLAICICRIMNQPAFCIFIDTVCGGRVPAWHDESQLPVIYPTVEGAQREIADDVMNRLQQFLNGERDFDDAMTIEDYILPVDVLPDGSIVDEDGNIFGKQEQ